MTSLVKTSMEHNIFASLEQIINKMLSAQDDIQASKMRQIIDKLQSDQLFITFCGHFSAGKSSLINYLCGEDLLPSSPIPTSANLVSIRNGVEQSTVQLRSGEVRKESSLAQLQEYSVNGVEIQSISIQYPIPMLQHNLTLLDTPGIDSTDDSHYFSTDSALHLADIVFYVMDYNHVQSEVNLNFVKRLQDMGKPLYLVVNQIDKHRDEELSLVSYQEGIKQAFVDWHIEPAGMFFISVKEHGLPNNELAKLEALLPSLSSLSQDLQYMNIKHSVTDLIKAHVRSSIEDHLHLLQKEYDFEEVLVQHSNLQAEHSVVNNHADVTEKLLKQEINQLLDNATITPALTRDLAHHYLQSCQPRFRAGLLSGQKKTIAERTKRLARFQQDLLAQISANITWHMQDLLRKKVEIEGVATTQVLESISQLNIDISTQWLEKKVQSGALFSNEYTMNYAKSITSEVKASYKKRAFEIADQLVISVREQSTGKLHDLECQLTSLAPMIEAYEYEVSLCKHLAWLPDDVALPDINTLEMSRTSPRHHVEQPTSKEKLSVDYEVDYGGNQEQSLALPFDTTTLRDRLLHAASQLNEATQLLEGLLSMQAIANTMKEKATRLEQSKFTIALFGAFSAGKSSFANALLGEYIVPVSPNPTTASIIKITAPQDEAAHGTAMIVLKTKEELFSEVHIALQQLGMSCQSLEDAFLTIRAIQPEAISSKGKPHYAFLRAVEQGWSSAEKDLGKQLTVDYETFKMYAAIETYSCFVTMIELSYSCPFTEAGFMLVDTPGADSINARHTDVAFDYIKNADLILFVTYFNHAFSQADRDFLNQLGRVKDSFELDKMFFIINAADLAASENELLQVVNHVQVNLVEHGIRHPRIFPVSSVKALQGKERSSQSLIDESGISRFEVSFINVMSDELVDLAIQSANSDINYAARVLEQQLTAAEEDEFERADKVVAIQHASQNLLQTMRHIEYREEKLELAKEINEQLHYVKQRVTFRFGEWYNLAFNPSNLRHDTADLRQALKGAFDELVHSLAFHCEQEVLAVTLRIENVMNRLAVTAYEQVAIQIKANLTSFESQPYEAMRFPTPKVGGRLNQVEVKEKWLLQQFKQPQYFFEGEGKNQLRKQLEERMFDSISVYIEEQAQHLTSYYEHEWQQWMNQLIKRQETNVMYYTEGIVLALENKINIADIRERHFGLAKMLVKL